MRTFADSFEFLRKFIVKISIFLSNRYSKLTLAMYFCSLKFWPLLLILGLNRLMTIFIISHSTFLKTKR